MNELARSLKLKRLDQGLSLAEISERSRIGIGVLQEIEAGNFSWIGSEFVIAAYLRAYNEALKESHRSNEGAQPEPGGARSNDWSRKLQQAETRVNRWRLLALIQMLAIIALILSEVLWVLARHPLSNVERPTNLHSEAFQYDLRPSMQDENLPASEKKDDLDVSEATRPPPTPVPAPEKNIEGAEAGIDSDGGSESGAEAPASNRLVRAELEAHTQGAQQQIFPSSVGLLNQLIDRTGQMSQGYFNADLALPDAEISDVGQESARNDPDRDGPDANLSTNDSGASHPSAARASADRAHQLEIETVTDCWVQIKIDGKQRVGDLLKAGEQRTWEIRKEVEILLGNAAGAKLKWDGHPLATMGKPGRVVRLRLPDAALVRKD